MWWQPSRRSLLTAAQAGGYVDAWIHLHAALRRLRQFATDAAALTVACRGLCATLWERRPDEDDAMPRAVLEATQLQLHLLQCQCIEYYYSYSY